MGGEGWGYRATAGVLGIGFGLWLGLGLGCAHVATAGLCEERLGSTALGRCIPPLGRTPLGRSCFPRGERECVVDGGGEGGGVAVAVHLGDMGRYRGDIGRYGGDIGGDAGEI